ncbi:hypothetical protein B0H17DRAFT_1108926 [Mycena rosella]|uniref:Uncharacterized protein n=1 Tax=Mycena rosella TaxID=1033263 RepID=A0AAD7FPB5_MYCRO|nr:hypothetical protein B0H17DRAFT_1108926 [Mycena rosella]
MRLRLDLRRCRTRKCRSGFSESVVSSPGPFRAVIWDAQSRRPPRAGASTTHPEILKETNGHTLSYGEVWSPLIRFSRTDCACRRSLMARILRPQRDALSATPFRFSAQYLYRPVAGMEPTALAAGRGPPRCAERRPPTSSSLGTPSYHLRMWPCCCGLNARPGNARFPHARMPVLLHYIALAEAVHAAIAVPDADPTVRSALSHILSVRARALSL